MQTKRTKKQIIEECMTAQAQVMTLDKKVKDGVVTWVLLQDAGQAVLRSDVPADIVRDVLTEVLS